MYSRFNALAGVPRWAGMSLLDVLSKISTLFHRLNTSVYFIFNSEWLKSRFGLALLSLFSLLNLSRTIRYGPVHGLNSYFWDAHLKALLKSTTGDLMSVT
jgi:hypothetical protein